jgi:hypothetical protein
MNVGIFRRAKIAPEKERFDTLQKFRVGRHHVRKLAVFGAGLTHDDLTVFFQNLCLDFARMLVHQGFERGLAGDDGGADFLNAARAQRICLAREAQRRRGALVRFQERPRSPLRANGLAFGQATVHRLKDFPRDIRKTGDQLGAFHPTKPGFFRFSSAKLIAKQR